MNFVTPEFAVFFLLFLLASWLVSDRPRKAFFFILLCGNLVFYAWAGWAFVPLLLIMAILTWGGVRLMQFADNKIRFWILALNICFDLSLLAFFKYYEFFVLNFENFLHLVGLDIPPLPLTDLLYPVGLSFYTFQGLAYTLDHYRNLQEDGETDPESFVHVLLFISFFPTVMAGPILRSKDFFPFLDQPCRDERALPEGMALILSGLFKKVVLASYLSEHIVRDVFQTPEMFSSYAVWAGVYGYSMQIFCDFSGYSDLATGIGRLMGFRLPQNFDSPYLALNLRDFWHRWHKTLSLWLRDYLYIPLGGSRRGNSAWHLLITMTLGGLWHGSHLRFLLWGLLHGLGLVVVHKLQKDSAIVGKMQQYNWFFHSWLGKIFSWLLTFHCVTLLWIFFRAENIDRAWEILCRLCYLQPGQGFPWLVIPAILAGFAVQLWGKRLFAAFTALQVRLHWSLQALIVALLVGFILKMGPDGVMPFIYFQF